MTLKVAGALTEYNARLDQRNYCTGDPVFLDSHETPVLVATYGEVEFNLTSKR